MNTDIFKQVKALRIAVVGLIIFNIFILFSAFEKKAGKQKFEEIDVERINIIENDGKLRMVMANKKRTPNAITNGYELKDSKGERGPGLILYNDDGDECGGYLFGNWGMHFSMDQFKQDQIVYMQVINGAKGEPPRTAGYWVSPQPALKTSDVVVKELESISKLENKSEREMARKSFWANLDSYNKAFMGKNRNDETGLFLFDRDFKTRLRAYVDSAGTPKLEFLDDKGNIIFSLPK